MVKDTLCGKLSWPSSSNTVPDSSSSSTYICGFYFIFRCHSHSSFRDSPIYLYNFGLSMDTDAFFWPPHIPKYHKPEEKRQRPITIHWQLLFQTTIFYSPVILSLCMHHILSVLSAFPSSSIL